MGRRSLRWRIRLPRWLFRVTRPAEWLVLDWSYAHGWGRRPPAPREDSAEPRPPVPTLMLWFPLRCLGSQECPTCAANWQADPVETVVPLVEA